MSKHFRTSALAAVAGSIALLMWMPFRSPCLLNMDRSAKPIQLAEPGESVYGMLVCDDFRPVFWHWTAVVVFIALVSLVGYVAGRAASGAVAAASSLTLAILAGHTVYPWFEAYWITAVESLFAIAVAGVLGAGGGWLASKKAQRCVQEATRKRARDDLRGRR
ncbi:MAG TPA: hypothetical protein PKE27_20000 [Povalibacter sp.]|uniref:hypothetical protein n=1 Tax=Povalibacter sp. TaxID=1962978 RepID=UPI002B8C70B8|nr:hypothetical protein [Povalibacter sp.]HMN46872.1 hypothetical protein [Povalibacter sp.]